MGRGLVCLEKMGLSIGSLKLGKGGFDPSKIFAIFPSILSSVVLLSLNIKLSRME